MSHENAKLLLAQADTLLKREEAIRTAMRQGMPLYEIEQYLDWLDQTRGSKLFNSPPAEGSAGPSN